MTVSKMSFPLYSQALNFQGVVHIALLTNVNNSFPFMEKSYLRNLSGTLSTISAVVLLNWPSLYKSKRGPGHLGSRRSPQCSSAPSAKAPEDSCCTHSLSKGTRCHSSVKRACKSWKTKETRSLSCPPPMWTPSRQAFLEKNAGPIGF